MPEASEHDRRSILGAAVAGMPAAEMALTGPARVNPARAGAGWGVAELAVARRSHSYHYT